MRLNNTCTKNKADTFGEQKIQDIQRHRKHKCAEKARFPSLSSLILVEKCQVQQKARTTYNLP